MGTISYWATASVRDLDGFIERPEPLTLAEVLAGTELVIEQEDGRWVLLLQGFPREWHHTQEEAQVAAQEWSPMSPTIEHAPGPTWLVIGGDQYIFTATSRAEAEAFVMGVAAGLFIQQAQRPND